MGTPEFAAVSLKRLAAWPRGRIVGVYTQPDRPAGRGHRPAMSAVKKLALELRLPVCQPVSLKSSEVQAELAALQPDVLAVAAYGLLLPDAVLAMPRLAPVNVHASLLPALRGAAPIQRAVMEGWQEGARAGVAIMRVVRKLDAGPVYAMESTPIGEHTAGSLHDAMALMGAELLVRVLDGLLDGTAAAQEQDESKTSYAPKISKEDGYIDWNLPVARVHAQVRGVTPWPGARTEAVFGATGQDASGQNAHSLIVSPGTWGGPVERGIIPGTLRHGPDGLSVACADRWYVLQCVRPQGRKDMPVRDFINGSLRGLPQGLCGTARKPG